MNKKMLLGSLFSMIAAGCSTGLSPVYRASMGRVEIVYLEPLANLTLCTGSPLANMQILPGMPGGLLVVPGDNAGDCDRYHPTPLPAGFAEQVRSLEFNQQVFNMFSSLVTATPWLANSKIETANCLQPENTLPDPTVSDSILFFKPVFSLAHDNLYFDVNIQVDIKNFNAVHQDQYKTFNFRNKLTLIKPGMPWSEQKELAYKLTFMNNDQRLQLWFADDGARLRTFFASDLRQVNQELAAYLHSRS